MSRYRIRRFVCLAGLCLAGCGRPAATPTAATGLPVAPEGAAFVPQGMEIPGPDVFATGRAEPYDATAAEMRDGRHMAFLVALEPGPPPQLVLDPAVLLGDAASIADGHTTYLGELPNGFYIRNLDPTTVTLPLSPTAAIELITFEGGGGQSTMLSLGPEAIAGWFAGTPVAGAFSFGRPPSRTSDGRLAAQPVHVTTAKGVIVALEEQYIP